MSGPFNDTYVLAPERSAALALSFLEQFGCGWEPLWDPNDFSVVLGMAAGSSLADVLLHLETDAASEHTLYFKAKSDDGPRFAILAFCEDGSLILGLSSIEGDDQTAVLARLEEFASSSGYVGWEEAPASSQQEFKLRREST